MELLASRGDGCTTKGCGGQYTARPRESPYINCFRCGAWAHYRPTIQRHWRTMELLYFYLDDCAPCAAKKPEIEQIVDATGTPAILIDLAQNIDVGESYQVRSVPALVLVDRARKRLAGWTGGMINKASVVAVMAAQAAKEANT